MKKTLLLSLLVCSFLTITLSAFAQNKAEELSSTSSTKYIANDFKGAIADISEAIKLMPTEYSYYQKRAEYKIIGNYAPQEVINDLNSVAYLIEQKQKKEEDALDILKSNLITALAYRAKMHLKIQNNSETIKDLSLLIDVYDKLQAETKDCTGTLCVTTTTIQAYIERGMMKYNNSDKKGAQTDFTKAFDISKGKNTDALYKIGFVKAELGDLSGALKDYTQAIAMGDASAAVYYNRGNVLQKLGRSQESCADWRRAGELGEKLGFEALKKNCN